MTTVTVHNADVTVTPAQPQSSQPTVQTQPSMPAIPINFDTHPAQVFSQGAPAVSSGYPLGGLQTAPAVSMAHHVNETPTQAAMNAGSKFIKVRDALGRVIGIKKMAPIDNMRISRFIGGELSSNPAYFGYASMAACVREIDGEPIPMATSARQLEDLVDKLGEDGLEAISRAILDAGWIKERTEKELLDEAKN
jgi:hypothetical protein